MGEIHEEAPESLLGGRASGVLSPHLRRHRRRLGQLHARPLEPLGGGAAQLALRCAGLERGPRVGGVGPELVGELLPLLHGEQGGVVAGMALGGQAPGLDRVGEDHRRAIGDGVRLGEGGEQLGDVVASEVADRALQLGVLEVGDQGGHLAGAVAATRQALAQLAGVGAQEALVLLVRHRVDALAERGAAVALEQRLQAAAVLDGDRVPARGLEHRGDAPGGDVRHDAVERLAVEVHDPEHLARGAAPPGPRSPPSRRPRPARRRPSARSGGHHAAPRSAPPRSGARSRSTPARWRRYPLSLSRSPPAAGSLRRLG